MITEVQCRYSPPLPEMCFFDLLTVVFVSELSLGRCLSCLSFPSPGRNSVPHLPLFSRPHLPRTMAQNVFPAPGSPPTPLGFKPLEGRDRSSLYSQSLV